MTRPVLYYYFKNKEDLYCRLVESWMTAFMAKLDGQLARVEGFRDRLRTLMYDAFANAEREPEVVRLIVQVFFQPPGQTPLLDPEHLWRYRFDRIMAIMEEGVRAGELAERDPEVLAMGFCGMMDLYIMAKSHKPETELSRKLAEELVDLFLDGSAGPAAVAS